MVVVPQPRFWVEFEAPAEFDPLGFDPLEFDATPIAVRDSTVDDDSDTVPHYGVIANEIAITSRASDSIWRTLEATRVTVELANADGGKTGIFLRDVRGQTMVVKLRDAADNYLATVFNGNITQPTLGDVITIEASDLKASVLDDEIPKGTITDALFPGAKDIGQPLLVVFGNAVNVPLYCILDDRENDIFLYLAPRAIGDGALTFNDLKRDGVGGEEFALIHPSEYEVLTPAAAATLAGVDEYPSWATIVHFPERQFRHGSDELHTIVADISTPSADRNFSRVRRMILQSAWGLSQDVNGASFDAAVSILDALGDLYADGVLGLNGTVRAGDVLRLLGMAADMWITNEDGEWVEHVDTYTPTVQLEFHDGPDEGVRNIVDIGPLTPRSTDDMIKDVVFKFRPRGDKWIGEIRRTVPAPSTWAATHGEDLTIEHPYVNNAVTAGKIVSRRVARIRFTDTTLKLSGLSEARAIAYGDIVTVTATDAARAAALNGKTFEVAGVTRHLTRSDLELQGGDPDLYAAIYANETGAIPDDIDIDPIVDYTRTVPDPATGLTFVSEIAYRNAAGQDVGAARFSFTVPTTNCQGYQFGRRVNGTTEWMRSGVIHATGAQTYRIEPLVTGQLYDVAVFTVNEPGNKSTLPADLVEGVNLITGYQAAVDTTTPATPTGFSAVPGVGGIGVRLTTTKPTESDYALTYFFRSLTDTIPSDITSAVIAGKLIARPNTYFYDDPDVVQGTQYFYKAAHADHSGNGSALCASDDATPTGAAQGTAPAKPAPALTFLSATTYQGTNTVANSTGQTLARVRVRVPTQSSLDVNAAWFRVLAKRDADAGYIPVSEKIPPASLPFDVDVPGGLPGEKYNLTYFSGNNLGKVSPLADVLDHIALGDQTCPGVPTSLILDSSKLSSGTFKCTLPSDRDGAVLRYEIRSASSAQDAVGAGSLLKSGSVGVGAPGSTMTWTIDLSTIPGFAYGTTYYVRVQLRDHTANPTLDDTSSFSAGTTNGSSILTGLAGLSIGMPVSGTNIPGGSSITSIPSATTVSIAPATATGTGTPTLTFGARWTATTSFSVSKLTGPNVDDTGSGIDTPQIVAGAVTGNSPYIDDTPVIVGTTSELIVDQIDVTGVTAGARVDLQVFYFTNVSSGTNTVRLRKGTTTGGTILDSFPHSASTDAGMLFASDASPGVGTQSYVLTIEATNVASVISRVRAMRLLAKR